MNFVETDLPSQELIELADAYGVSHEYWGFDGNLKKVSTATLVATLKALGVDASSPERIAIEKQNATDAPWRTPLEPTTVARQGAGRQVAVHVTADLKQVDVWVEFESVTGWGPVNLERAWGEPEVRTVDGRAVARILFELPDHFPAGWHTLNVYTVEGQHSATLIITPNSLSVPDYLNDKPAWGLMAQLYSVRSKRSWGIGDFADLGDLGWLSGNKLKSDFLLINPVSASEPNSPLTPSPYLPVTRRFVSPLYIRVEDIKETGYLSAADRSVIQWAADEVTDLNVSSDPIDRDTVWDAKKRALKVVFTAGRSVSRDSQFNEFRRQEGKGLEDFATWCALHDHFKDADAWPEEYLDANSEAVRLIRPKLSGEIEFYAWLQWIADEQLRAAQEIAKESGMRIGIMHDLAVGVHPEGSDAWSLASVLAQGVSVGAPPDMYNQQGQDWSQPPWNPKSLAQSGYAPYRELVRTLLKHAGALRIDHVLGLFRLWWIPQGHTPDQGTYVRFDHEALIGILVLEASRTGAVIIGEDLGTFEGWVRDYLTDRGILGTSVLWFEKNHQGLPLEPEYYRRAALATVTTHDLPPTAGYLAGEHVDLRNKLGLLTEPIEVVRNEANLEREQTVHALQARGFVGDQPTERELVEGLHKYIKATPSLLLGVALTDAVGERRTQNQPGTDQEYPNWKIPLGDSLGKTVLIEDLFINAKLFSIADVMNS